ncbi:hypothetical protein GQ53DRAFT_750802 [Thozetella sp. PMI_491]|nr:hypothetical protein GQ53DRAFT_750802 [Thozetella sp. PMI_491]
MDRSSPNLLSPRDAIVDALSRALVGCDNHDAELFNSAWAGEEVSFEILGGEKKVLPNLNTIRTHVLDRVGPMDTTHSISNIRVTAKDGADDTATITATSMAQHCPPGRGKEPDGPKYMVAGEYSADVVKMDGIWKLKKCALKVIWTQGDPSVMGGP